MRGGLASYLVPGFPAGFTPRSVVLFPEQPADGRWGAGFTARVVWPPTFATMMHRPCGELTPIHSLALVDLIVRVPGAPPE